MSADPPNDVHAPKYCKNGAVVRERDYGRRADVILQPVQDVTLWHQAAEDAPIAQRRAGLGQSTPHP